jgi:hypothetical protein
VYCGIKEQLSSQSARSGIFEKSCPRAWQAPDKVVDPLQSQFLTLISTSCSCRGPEMATLADELLNDFEDSGSEDGNAQNDFLNDEDRDERNGHAFTDEPTNFQVKMELDDDEEEVEDADEERAAQNEGRGLDDIPDEEETKAKVEKMNLGGVGDVRSVAVLMKTALQPVLEVIASLFSSDPLFKRALRLHLWEKQT